MKGKEEGVRMAGPDAALEAWSLSSDVQDRPSVCGTSSVTRAFVLDGALTSEFTDVCFAHRFVMSMFPQSSHDAARAAMGILFRVSDDRQAVVVRSTVAPERERSGCRLLGQLTEPSLVVGGHYHFELLAAPTKCRYSDRRSVALEEARWLGWLEKHLPGCTILDVASEDRGELRGLDSRGRGVVAYHAARFIGIIRCDAVPPLAACLENGVGKGRAYGLGLMVVRAVQ